MRISDWSSDVCSSDLAKLLGEFGHRACMIEMSMCDQHLLDRHAVVLRTLQQAFGLAAGIDQRAAHRRVVPDQRTILLERGNRNNFAAQAHVRDTDCAPLAGRAPVSTLGRARKS